MKNLIIIVGPTAIGKTSLSIFLAKHLNCEIISCDSRQFFKEMCIGTAVPTKEELIAAQHHFIQNKSIFENYTVGDFEKEAIEQLNDLFLTNDSAIMVGGSGLYVEAVIKGLDNFPEIDPEIKFLVQAKYEQFGLEYLQQELGKLDFDYFKEIKDYNPQTLQNPQRMKRFVEVCLGTNKPYSSFLNKKKNQRNFRPVLIGLEAERAIIYDRIDLRVDQMIAEDLLGEVKKLLPYKKLNALQTVGYKELFSFLEGDITLETAIEEIKKNTRRFAKRQLTWFKRNEKTKWFDYLSDREIILDYINQQIKTNPTEK